jgi:hypothetical protein
LTVKLGSSARPSRVKANAPAIAIATIRNRVIACSRGSAHDLPLFQQMHAERDDAFTGPKPAPDTDLLLP